MEENRKKGKVYMVHLMIRAAFFLNAAMGCMGVKFTTTAPAPAGDSGVTWQMAAFFLFFEEMPSTSWVRIVLACCWATELTGFHGAQHKRTSRTAMFYVFFLISFKRFFISLS